MAHIIVLLLFFIAGAVALAALQSSLKEWVALVRENGTQTPFPQQNQKCTHFAVKNGH